MTFLNSAKKIAPVACYLVASWSCSTKSTAPEKTLASPFTIQLQFISQDGSYNVGFVGAGIMPELIVNSTTCESADDVGACIGTSSTPSNGINSFSTSVDQANVCSPYINANNDTGDNCDPGEVVTFTVTCAIGDKTYTESGTGTCA